jgi:hypothetical protein
MTGARKNGKDYSWTASCNRDKDWTECCNHARGFDWVDQFVEEESPTTRPFTTDNHGIQQIINLLDDDDDDGEEETKNDSFNQDQWTENALRIHADLTRMATWIVHKQHEYIGLDMGEDEASLIQSTVTSFAATTASELETLRKLIPGNSHFALHQSGIVQILLSQLQTNITVPFGKLQKQRSRMAVHLWQNPQQCKLHQSKPDNVESNLLGLLEEDEEDQRFFPRRERPLNDLDFLSKYERDEETNLPMHPVFLKKLYSHPPPAQQEESTEPLTTLSSPSPVVKKMEIPQSRPYRQQQNQTSHHDEAAYRDKLEEDAQHESQLLTIAVQNNDLDSVQKMETRMVEITTLISQFSNLVGEQQENVLHIHDSAKSSKENIEKGQEHLVDATQRKHQSKHWLAWSIFCMSMILLFFNVLRN